MSDINLSKSDNNLPKPRLSVIIVSYNCAAFLGLTLHALLWKAQDGLEVLVVDNASSDDTAALLRSRFPQVELVLNAENVGFGRACNQGMERARGEYLLMLNPDTYVPEDLCERVVDFMDQHPDGGAMGVRMLDGRGRFLPESKRGLPTVFRSFCRFSGLSRLFPSSALLAGYYAAQVGEHETAPVEVLSGAFMVLRRTAVEQVGGFDEDFFMYGEDIDLSWRIHRAGFRNYYHAGISIVHFKGESTLRNRRYVEMFYGAMELFYQKHTKRKGFWSGSWLVVPAIRMLARLSLWRLAFQRRPGREETRLPASALLLSEEQTPVLRFAGLERVYPCCHNGEQTLGAEACLLDTSTCRPSKILDFVNRKALICKQFLWLLPNRKILLQPLSASNRSVIHEEAAEQPV